MASSPEQNRRNAIALYGLMFNGCKRREAVERYRVVRTVAEGDLVVLHCHQVWPTDANKDRAGIDILRFDGAGKIVEHRAVLQVVPAEARHANGMF